MHKLYLFALKVGVVGVVETGDHAHFPHLALFWNYTETPFNRGFSHAPQNNNCQFFICDCPL